MKIQFNIKMFPIVVCSLLFLDAVCGAYVFYPWTTANSEQSTAPKYLYSNPDNNETPTGRMYFPSFDLGNLNPANWFTEKTRKSNSDQKINKLYQLVECVIENGPGNCKQNLATTKKEFVHNNDHKKDDSKPGKMQNTTIKVDGNVTDAANPTTEKTVPTTLSNIVSNVS